MKNLDEINQLLAELEGELLQLNARRDELLKRSIELQQERGSLLREKRSSPQTGNLPPVTDQSPEDSKIALFRSLFRGREDVYARRFENLKTGKKGYWPVRRNEWASGDRELLPITDEVVKNHLLGIDPQDKFGRDFTIGVYPMLLDETCYFLAADFDKVTWQADTGAFLETCALYNVPAVLERSRSGNGAHIWIFFSESIPASLARKMGSFLLTQPTQTQPPCLPRNTPARESYRFRYGQSNRCGEDKLKMPANNWAGRPHRVLPKHKTCPDHILLDTGARCLTYKPSAHCYRKRG